MREFAINYNNGYIVCLVAYCDTWKRKRFYPLRNFGEHQGDARIFKESDCLDLTDAQILMLIKSYKPTTIFKRLSSKRFSIETK